jgi:hypothetical protein
MTTNLTTTGNTNPFEAYGEATVNRHIVGQLLKFAKGDYVTGDGAEIPIGTRMIAIMSLLLVGWIKWVDGVSVEHRMGAVADGYMPPRRAELGDDDETRWSVDEQGRPRDPWQLANYLILANPDTQELYTFTTGSRGGLSAIGELSKKYGRHIRQAPGDLPLIELEVGSYMHRDKAFGKIKVPILNVVNWTNGAAYFDLLEGGSSAPQPKSESMAIEHERAERAAKANRRAGVAADAEEIPY